MDSAKSDGFDRESADIYVSAHQTKQFTTLYFKKDIFSLDFLFTKNDEIFSCFLGVGDEGGGVEEEPGQQGDEGRLEAEGRSFITCTYSLTSVGVNQTILAWSF